MINFIKRLLSIDKIEEENESIKERLESLRKRVVVLERPFEFEVGDKVCLKSDKSRVGTIVDREYDWDFDPYFFSGLVNKRYGVYFTGMKYKQNLEEALLCVGAQEQ